MELIDLFEILQLVTGWSINFLLIKTMCNLKQQTEFSGQSMLIYNCIGNHKHN